MKQLTDSEILKINNINTHTKQMGFGNIIKDLLNDGTPIGSPVNAVNATKTLTIDTQPTIGNTMTIGTKVYTFVASGSATTAGKISIGTDLPTAKLAIVAAINGTDGVNAPHPLVSASAFVANVCTITALVAGVAGNSIGTTKVFTAGTNTFASATLTGGIDGTIGAVGSALIDNTYLYKCIANNTTSGKNWRRIALGTAF